MRTAAAIFLLISIFFITVQAEAFTREAHLRVAKHWIGKFRADPGCYSGALYNIRDAQKNGVALREIGTDEGELEYLRQAGCRINAMKLIASLRYETGVDRNLAKGLLCEEVGECNLNLRRMMPSIRLLREVEAYCRQY